MKELLKRCLILCMYNRGNTMDKDNVDHSGESFGCLTLLYKGEPYIAPKSGKKKQRYYCSCSCGKYTKDNPKLIVYESIKSGLISSCGCLKSKHIINKNKSKKKYNTYNLSGEHGIGYTSKGEKFYFDLGDYNLIKDYCWYIDDNGYVKTHIYGKHISMHRMVMGFPDLYFDIDHKNSVYTRNDNRKENLRIATCSQNQMNRGLQVNNTSGVTGVYWHKRDKVWESYITINKKSIYLGRFTNFEDAVRARKAAEEKYFGEFSYENSIGKGDINVDLS